MMKLVIKKGRDEGRIFELADGVYTIGRGPESSIHISSPSISKEHARITVNGNQIELEDLNSTNGTFVNGALIKSYQLKHGDKINLHESTLELIGDEVPIQSRPFFANIPSTSYNIPQSAGHSLGKRGFLKNINTIAQTHILPMFYKMLETIEWKYVFAILFFTFAILSVVLTIAPLSSQSKRFLQLEARNQAQFITKQLAEENRRGIYLKNEVILSTKIAEGEDRVLSAVIVDKRGRIMAPASRMNLTVSEQPAIEALKHEETFIRDLGSERVLVSEPVRIFSQVEGKNIVGAYAQIIYSLRGIGLTNAGITRIFINAIIWTLLIGAIFYLLIVRITLKPLEVLTADLENNSLSGFKKLNRRFRFQALDEVMRKINSLAWQLKTGLKVDDTMGEDQQQQEINEAESKNFHELSNLMNYPIFLLKKDGTLCDINRAGEEFLNLSRETAVKQPISSLFIDIALMSTITDLINQIPGQLPGQLSGAKDGSKSEVISTPEGHSIKISVTPVRTSDGNWNSVIVQLTKEEDK